MRITISMRLFQSSRHILQAMWLTRSHALRKGLKGQGKRVALMDFGAKNNIAKSLNERGCEVTIYPAHTTAEEILGDNPDGIMLSNGPGDPKECVDIIKEIKKLYDSNVPILQSASDISSWHLQQAQIHTR